MTSLKTKIKSLTSKQKKTGLAIICFIIIVAILSSMGVFLRYQHNQYKIHHAEVVRAEHLPNHPVTVKKR